MQHGFSVDRASSGAEGIELARRAHPDLIVLDLVMPGMNGFDVVHRLREDQELSKIPILILTAKDLTLEEREVLRNSVQAVVTKGGRSALLAELRRLVDRGAGVSTILVVDDHPLNLELVTDILEASGYRVLQAGTGEDALASVSAQRPDLILMDIALPGMDGHDAVRTPESGSSHRSDPGDRGDLVRDGRGQGAGDGLGVRRLPFQTDSNPDADRGRVPVPRWSPGMSEDRFNAATATGRVLVVDDQEPNRLLLTEILALSGHQTEVAASGPEALAKVVAWEPDLILLDVHMPGMDGFEVCRRLRGDSNTASLPIILVTSLDHREHRLKGIAAGANDYLTKPIDRTDLVLRVRNALHMRRLHQAVAEQYRALQLLEQQRDSLVHMIAHDLRSPLTGITAYLELVEEQLATMGHTQVIADLREARDNARMLSEMVSDMLDVSRFEDGAMPLKPASVDLREVVRKAITGIRWASGEVEIDFPAPPHPVLSLADDRVTERVVANLVGNAAKYTPKGERVRIELSQSDSGPLVRIIDRGPGISPEYHDRIFDKFAQVDGGAKIPGRSTGLGLTFCRLAIEAQGGRIGVTSAVGAGSTFWFALPAG